MLIPVPPSECMRAREAVSGRLDEELAELEEVRLAVHLRRCPECREFARSAALFTDALRTAPLEQPRARVFAPRRRTRIAAVRVQAAAAAAVALAATGSLALGRIVGNGGGGAPRFTSSAPATDISSARADSAEQRLLALLPRPRQQPPTVHTGPVVPL